MSASGIIFSNIHDHNIPELTRLRTVASIPFACRYRFIDFTLSNMVNSDIYNIHIITQYNYHSLMDHIGSGKDWDLARRGGGIKILPPNITAYAGNVDIRYQTRLEALKGILHSIGRIRETYVVLSDCDVICNVDLQDIIAHHASTGADITVAVKSVHLTQEQAKNSVLYRSDGEGRITDILSYPDFFAGTADMSLNIVVMKTEYLQKIVLDATAHHYVSLTRDVMTRNLHHADYRIYKYDGYFASITSFAEYYAHSMEILRDPAVRSALFEVKNRPIYTKVRNSVPAYYGQTASAVNSMVADGCDIEGQVENSILFRGVKVGRNSAVKNSILMQDTVVGDGVVLNHVITDKNAVIRDSQILVGAELQPFYIAKGQML